MLLGLLVKMFLKFVVFLVFISQFASSEITSNDYLNHYLENKENTKLLKVDFVVIQNLNIDKTDLKEKWEILNTFNFSEELIALKEEPTKLVSLPSKYITDKSVFHFIEAGKKENTEKVVESKTQRIKPFLYERIPFEKEMQKIEKNLNRSRDYRVLYYNSWFQPAFNKNKTIPIAINQIKKSNKVYGEIKIYKERFIHLDSKLRFATEVDESEASSSSSPSNIFEFQTLLEDREDTKKAQKEKNNYWVDTIFNTVQINLESFSKIIYEEETKNLDSLNQEPVMAFEDLYEIKKDVKIEDNEFNFIDHPFFSILIRVQELSN
jgi:hypothetical protein